MSVVPRQNDFVGLGAGNQLSPDALVGTPAASRVGAANAGGRDRTCDLGFMSAML